MKKLNYGNLTIYLFLIIMMLFLCWVGYSNAPVEHVVVQRGQSQPPEQYHRFNYDKTYLLGMEDTLVWEHKTSFSGNGITITNLRGDE